MRNNTHLGTKDHVTYLKGLAILAVVGIHTINSFMSLMERGSLVWNLSIILDQVFRFSVPLFVAISGYSLAKRYSKQSIQFNEFFQKRVIRLIPLYLVWSITYYISSKIIPGWQSFNFEDPIWKVLLLGRAEYHLYFVPMIFQAYLLFPIIFPFIKRFPWLILIFSLIVQVHFFNKINFSTWNDQMQYLVLLSWQFYFVLGIFLSQVSSKVIKILSLALIVFGFFFTLNSFSSTYFVTSDVIWSTKFTRIPVLIYASGVIILMLASSRASRPITLINYIGKYSYGIYLGHVLVLHLLTTFLLKSS